jgi:DNA repair protein RecN (Recombination protein N)
MLRSLTIKNLAIIDALTLEFGAGFHVLTGETGAGKSILIDAIGLALGSRGDPGLVRSGAERAEITAEFALDHAPDARAWLAAHELLDGDDPALCLIRRVVYAEGRSRAFVNNTAVAGTALRELGNTLIEIFGQNDSQTLLRSDVQRARVDDFGEYPELLEAVASAHARWQRCVQEIERLRASTGRDPAELDYLRHQLQELETLGLREGELAQLDEDHKRLANAGRLLQDGTAALEQLYGGEPSAYDLLSQVSSLLGSLRELHGGFAEAGELVGSAMTQAREAADVLQKLLDRLELDPAALVAVERRLSAVQDLARKHRVRADELLGRWATLQTELSDSEQAAEGLEQLQRQLEQAEAGYREQAALLSERRQDAAQRFSAEVTARVRRLGMANAQFIARVASADDARPRSHGADDVCFEFSANPGQVPRALAKVASGGELSRLSLAMQVTARQNTGVGTMIFDEVDAGIGGGVAEIVGQELRALGDHHQVLCVTHLAQVASAARHHYGIYKEVVDGQTFTRVRPVEAESRTREIARMMGGIEITASTEAHARELLERAGS